nr:MAG TPA: hypothetical protein [Caudoviricetes sp.]
MRAGKNYFSFLTIVIENCQEPITIIIWNFIFITSLLSRYFYNNIGLKLCQYFF